MWNLYETASRFDYPYSGRFRLDTIGIGGTRGWFLSFLDSSMRVMDREDYFD